MSAVSHIVLSQGHSYALLFCLQLSEETVDLLLSHGASLSVEYEGKTPIQHAVLYPCLIYSNRAEVVSKLVAAGADPQALPRRFQKAGITSLPDYCLHKDWPKVAAVLQQVGEVGPNRQQQQHRQRWDVHRQLSALAPKVYGLCRQVLPGSLILMCVALVAWIVYGLLGGVVSGVLWVFGW